MNLYIIIFVISLLIIYNIFVFLLNRKIKKLEFKIIDLFKKRNNQITTIYWLSKNDLIKKDEIFKEFFELKRKDFSENYYNLDLEDKIDIYKKIHNEINFIFNVCEKHKKISVNPNYVYIKETVLDKSSKIWEYMQKYKSIKTKYAFLKKISYFTIIWIFIK